MGRIVGRVFSHDFIKPAWTVQFSQCTAGRGVVLLLLSLSSSPV
jgi:hypothetical protein